MPNRVSRRERRRRLYNHYAVIDKMKAAYPQLTPAEWPAMFDTGRETFELWLAEEEPVPPWIVQLAERLYRVPPPARRIPPLLWLTGAIVVAGVLASLALRFL